ncbi:DNA cytosine methyltransferase [Pseudofrankia inefficax]|nr:DNA cytosine methyltransferase [Pseudofrankia inefficax]
MGSAGPRKPKLVDLFCGAGGLSEGFRRVGFEVVAAADHDPDACATYERNFARAEVLCGDLRLPALRERLVDLAAGADMIVGGPPCQAYSQVRNHARLIDDPRNSLYREFVRTVREVRPVAFLMENVPGLAQMGVQDQVVADLSLDGEYDVTAQLVDAANFGVPQTRERLLFLGVRRRRGISVPVLDGSGATGLVRLERAKEERALAYKVGVAGGAEADELAAQLADWSSLQAVTVAQAISDLEGLASGRRDDAIERTELGSPGSAYQRLMRRGLVAPSLTNVSVPRIREDTVLRLNEIPAGGNHRDLPDEFRARYLTDAKWGQHSGTGRLERRHYSAYRRLHPDLWAWTINTKADCAYHYRESRSLSVREFARLQSFPDYFEFTTDKRRGDGLPGRLPGGATHSRYRQVGNAVPPLLAQAAAKALIDHNVFAELGVLRTP